MALRSWAYGGVGARSSELCIEGLRDQAGDCFSVVSYPRDFSFLPVSYRRCLVAALAVVVWCGTSDWGGPPRGLLAPREESGRRTNPRSRKSRAATSNRCTSATRPARRSERRRARSSQQGSRHWRRSTTTRVQLGGTSRCALTAPSEKLTRTANIGSPVDASLRSAFLDAPSGLLHCRPGLFGQGVSDHQDVNNTLIVAGASLSFQKAL